MLILRTGLAHVTEYLAISNQLSTAKPQKKKPNIHVQTFMMTCKRSKAYYTPALPGLEVYSGNCCCKKKGEAALESVGFVGHTL